MHAAVRSNTAAGVALLAASAIAVSPLAPPMPDVQATVHRAVSSVQVGLDAVVNPLESLTQLFVDSAGNLTALGAQFASNPAPILAQLITNQRANAAVIADGLQQTVDTLRTQIIPAVPGQLQMIADQLRAGDIAGAVNTVFQIPLGFVFPVALFALPAVFQVTTNATQNFANVVAAIGAGALPVGLAAINPIFAATTAFGDQAQEVFDAVGDRDLKTAAGAALSTPTEILNAFLNGNGVVEGSPGDVQNPGIFTPGTNGAGFNPGLIAAVLNFKATLADAMHPLPAPPVATAFAVPTAKTFTLHVGGFGLEGKPTSTSADSSIATVPRTPLLAGRKNVADVTRELVKAGDGGRHRAQAGHPFGSAVKRLRDSAGSASIGPRHAADSASAS